MSEKRKAVEKTEQSIKKRLKITDYFSNNQNNKNPTSNESDIHASSVLEQFSSIAVGTDSSVHYEQISEPTNVPQEVIDAIENNVPQAQPYNKIDEVTENDQDVTNNVKENVSLIPLDIGNYVGATLDDQIKKNILRNPWVPPSNYIFLYSTHQKQGKEEKRYAGHQHLRQFNWLVFSDIKKGFFCKYCFLFMKDKLSGYHKTVALGKLVNEPLISFAKLLGKDGDVTKHESNKYHKECVSAATEFLKITDNPELSILNIISTDRLNQVTENRKRLTPIIESVIFLGKQNIPFRGHRDDGPVLNETEVNEGNFRELLRLRVKSGDLNLKKHLENSSARATYVSKTTQNQLIHFCGEEILSTIITRINDAKYYNIMFDETTDIANVSQLSLVIRYFWKKSIYEDFVGFLDVQSDISAMNENFDNTMELKATGLNLGQIVLKKLKDMGMNLNHCVGITTDACSVMTSDSCGAVKTVMAETKNASYCPCYNHKLNLSISQLSSVQAIRNVVGTLKDVIAFFKASAKRSHLLKNVMGHKLCGLCETRWVERHDGVIQFRDCIGKVIETLDHIATWTDMHTAAKAKSLRLSLCNGEVIISIVCLANLLNCTLQLSRYFQKTRIDMKSAQEFLVDTITILSNKRKKSEEYFANLFEEARSTAEELDVELKVPRLAGKQKNRENHSCKSVEDYYRVTIFIRLLDNIIAD
uniref:DUF4371 domain-containing protein n=1 Tax=Trichogramma kaykai TaxID=54128 RepID=A0ABD2W917_9HYME